MDSIDLDVLKTSAQWIASNHRCQLVTVTKTWGSSPRPIGAMLAICDDGRIVGSVSGGCIEDDLIARMRQHGIDSSMDSSNRNIRSTPEIVSYGISFDQARRFGLPCGGSIELAIETLSQESQIDALLQRLAQHELVARRLDLATGAVTLAKGDAGAIQQLTSEALTTLHGPRWRLFIIGAGSLSRFLAQIASAMDYQVIVCDPREEYRANWHVDGVQLVHAMPDDLMLEAKLDARSAVVALTHDPKLDDLALMEALKSEAFYVGAIGSRVNQANRRERLLEFDVSPAQVARLHGPIGLYIGSKTPAEIAISIMAQMTAIKNGVPPALQVGHAEAPFEPSAAVCALT